MPLVLGPDVQTIDENLYTLFAGLPENKATVLHAPFEVRFHHETDSATVVQPGLCVITDSTRLDARGYTGAPELVVEIFQSHVPHTYRKTKIELYKKSGVKEYWEVDAGQKQVHVYVLRNTRYEAFLFASGTIKSSLFPSLKISTVKLFRGTEPERKEETSQEVQEPGTAYGTPNYTYWDYLRWLIDERAELICGKMLKMSPAPNRSHQEISRNLTGILLEIFKKNPCRLFYAPFDVRLPVPGTVKDSTVVQPDLCIICDADKLDQRGCNGAPDLVVEILSPGNSRHEMNTKFKLYEQSGVKEYWIVEPERKWVLVYTLKGNAFVGLSPFTEGQTVKSHLFGDLAVSVDEIFYNIK